METSIMTERDTCLMGAATESPCPYPATEPVPRWSEDMPKICAYHAATEPLAVEYDALHLALELLKAWEKAARRHDNGPLLGMISRARKEFSERLELVGPVVEGLEAADRRLFRKH